jgi:hypothetical protein
MKYIFKTWNVDLWALITWIVALAISIIDGEKYC